MVDPGSKTAEILNRAQEVAVAEREETAALLGVGALREPVILVAAEVLELLHELADDRVLQLALDVFPGLIVQCLASQRFGGLMYRGEERDLTRSCVSGKWPESMIL